MSPQNTAPKLKGKGARSKSAQAPAGTPAGAPGRPAVPPALSFHGEHPDRLPLGLSPLPASWGTAALPEHERKYRQPPSQPH